MSATVYLIILYCVLLQALYDVMIEAVFPSCAIAQLMDEGICQNETTMSRLASGEAYLMAVAGQLTAGSSAEGLAIIPGWGHPWADIDWMYLFGGQLGVHLPQRIFPLSHKSRKTMTSTESSHDHATSCLEYDPEGCPPAYTRLKVSKTVQLVKPWIEESDGNYWLCTTMMHEDIRQGINGKRTNPHLLTAGISGPAGQALGGLVDMVLTLVANTSHPAMNDYPNTPHTREWPSQDQLAKIRQLPMLLVMTGHKESPNKHQEARFSWSPAEIILLSKLPELIKQGYIAAKYTMKDFLKIYRELDETADGRSYVGSFHLKTTLLHFLSKTPPSKIISPFGLMLDLLYKLSHYLTKRTLPHYFLPEVNLLETVGPEEQEMALEVIQDIVLDPTAAILNCPSVLREIYGNIRSRDLVRAFDNVSAHPSCERSWDDLSQLLSRLDEWRQWRYMRQLEWDDGRYKLCGRSQLRTLTDMLKRIKHM